MNPPITNATLYFLVQYFGLDMISTLLLYKTFWLKMFEQFIYSPGMWHGSCVPIKHKMKLTRTDLSIAKAFDIDVVTMW